MNNHQRVQGTGVSFLRGRIFAYGLVAALLFSILYVAYTIPRNYATHTATRVLFGLPLEFKKSFYFEIDYFGMIYSGHSNNWVDSWVLTYGAYERPVIEFLSQNRKFLRKGKENAVAVDVGAYHGTYSMFMTTIFDTVHAIEPNPAALRSLTKQRDYNKLDKLKIHPVGFGATQSNMPMYDTPLGDSAAASLREGFRGGQTNKVEIQIVPGDEYLASNGISDITFIKMDIEGFEKPALQGLTKLLNNNRPVVVMELNHQRDYGFKSLDDLKQAFPEKYDFLVFDGETYSQWPNYSLKPFKFEELDKQPQLVIVPSELMSELKRQFP